MGKRTVLSENKVSKPKEITLNWSTVLGTVKEIPEGYKTAAEIAKEVGMSPATVRVKMADLITKGHAHCIKKSGTGHYKLITPKD
jgi:predicted transcriptional regulator